MSRRSAPPTAQQVQPGHLGAGAARQDPHQPEVVHVLVGEHDEPEVLDAAAVRVETPLELVERRARVGPESSSVSGSSSMR